MQALCPAAAQWTHLTVLTLLTLVLPMLALLLLAANRMQTCPQPPAAPAEHPGATHDSNAGAVTGAHASSQQPPHDTAARRRSLTARRRIRLPPAARARWAARLRRRSIGPSGVHRLAVYEAMARMHVRQAAGYTVVTTPTRRPGQTKAHALRWLRHMPQSVQRRGGQPESTCDGPRRAGSGTLSRRSCHSNSGKQRPVQRRPQWELQRAAWRRSLPPAQHTCPAPRPRHLPALLPARACRGAGARLLHGACGQRPAR